MAVVKKCEVCSAPATIFLTQIINGKSTKVSLCGKCAEAQGILDPSAFDLAEKLFSIPSPGKTKKSEQIKLQPVSTHLPLTVCPTCGFTLENYRTVGRLGCSKCYDVFAEEIMPVLARIQGALDHKGKHPKHAIQEIKRDRDVSELKNLMADAIKSENYEEAAKLRDMIAEIQHQH